MSDILLIACLNGGRAGRYIHQRLQQCPEQERLIAMAQKLAVAQEKPVSSIRPLEARVFRNDCRELPGRGRRGRLPSGRSASVLCTAAAIYVVHMGVSKSDAVSETDAAPDGSRSRGPPPQTCQLFKLPFPAGACLGSRTRWHLAIVELSGNSKPESAVCRAHNGCI